VDERIQSLHRFALVLDLRRDPLGGEVLPRLVRGQLLVALDDLLDRLADALDDRQALEVQQIENLQREDIHPLEEAAGYRVMLTQLNYTVADIAAKVGKDESYIYRRLKLTDLIELGQQACWEEQITPGMAALICRLTPADQAKALDACIPDRGGWAHVNTVRGLQDWIDRNIMLDLHKAAFPKDDATLVPGVGDCISCPKRTGASPMLFPEIKKADTCTDGSCYKAKVAAYVARREAELKAKDPELVKVSGRWHSYGEKPDLPGPEAYTELTPKEAKQRDDAKKVLVVDGDKAGQTIYAVFDRGRSGGVQKTAAEKAADARARAEEKLAAEIQRRQVFAVVDAVEQNAEPIRGNLLSFVVRRVWERWWNDAKRVIAKRRGLKIEDVDLGSMTEEQLEGLLIECCLIGYSDYDAGRLQEAAELLEIELEPIAEAARLEAKEKTGKAKKAEPEPVKPAKKVPPPKKAAKKKPEPKKKGKK
jgi:ParB family chromosome partitioning protein